MALCLQAGWVHRDLCWENIACDVSKQHFFLLDLEAVAPADQLPGFHLVSWGDDTLQANVYTRLSDLRMLGKMMFECRDLLKSQAAQEVLRLLTGAAGPTPHLSAQNLLDSTWINCSGDTCRAAGAQPNDRQHTPPTAPAPPTGRNTTDCTNALSALADGKCLNQTAAGF